MQEEDVRSISEFADAAKRYCSMIEDIEDLDGLSFAESISEILAELYLKAQRMPVGEAFFDPRTSLIGDELYSELCRKIAARFRWRNNYWVILNPHVQEEVSKGSLGDDLADIYKELKENMALYDSGSPGGMAEAAWYWKFSFMAHWGYHAADALRVIHWIMFG